MLKRHAASIAAAFLIAACGDAGRAGALAPSAPATPSAEPSRAPTKPPSPTASIAAPTKVAWGIDGTGDAARPFWFELYFDGGASAFRVVDTAGHTVLRLPIAGSGIFDGSTCLVRETSKASGRNATWVGIDEATHRQILSSAGGYHVEAETVDGAPAVTLPLVDSGCRP